MTYTIETTNAGEERIVRQCIERLMKPSLDDLIVKIKQTAAERASRFDGHESCVSWIQQQLEEHSAEVNADIISEISLLRNKTARLRKCSKCRILYDRNSGALCLCGRDRLKVRLAELRAERDAAKRTIGGPTP